MKNKKSNAQRSKKNMQSKEEMHQAEATKKHSSLVAMSTKSIRKQAKIVKSFECQKIVRKIKSLRETEIEGGQGKKSVGSTSNSGNGGEELRSLDDAKVQKKLDALDEKLRKTKELNLEDIVPLCLRRAGLTVDDYYDDGDADADDGGGDDAEKDDDHDGTNNKNKNNSVDDEFQKSLMNVMIKHKRLSSAIESISGKVSEYNAWLARREDWLARGGKGGSSASRGNDDGNNNNHAAIGRRNHKRGREVDVAGHDSGSGLFIESLAGGGVMEPQEIDHAYRNFGDGDNEYGYNDDAREWIEQPPKKKKKNRMGQRARKAKTMAIEARKAGQTWDSSINWREKKMKKRPKDGNGGGNGYGKDMDRAGSASGLDKSKKIEVSEVAKMGKNWKEEGKAHPSWAAREAQKAKSGIGKVEFTGKKITFD